MINPIVIACLDPIIHTEDRPFCGPNNNPDWQTCPCHNIQDGQYYRLICRPLLDGLMTSSEANRLYFGDNPLDALSGMRADFKAASATLPSYESDGQWVNGDEEDDETGTHPPDCRCPWCDADYSETVRRSPWLW
jgi:hypothetical protein